MLFSNVINMRFDNNKHKDYVITIEIKSAYRPLIYT